MNRAEQWLGRLLYFGGIVLVLAAFAVVLPVRWMAWVHREFGMGEFPDRPLTVYLVRSVSGMYVFHGAIFFVVAGDVRRFMPVIRLLVVGVAVFGAMMVVIDLAIEMPWLWTAVEGPSLMAFGCFMTWLTHRVRKLDKFILDPRERRFHS